MKNVDTMERGRRVEDCKSLCTSKTKGNRLPTHHLDISNTASELSGDSGNPPPQTIYRVRMSAHQQFQSHVFSLSLLLSQTSNQPLTLGVLCELYVSPQSLCPHSRGLSLTKEPHRAITERFYSSQL